VLTDKDYVVLHLLRSHKFEEDAKIAIREKYPFSHAANLTIENITTNHEEIKEIIRAANVPQEPKEHPKEEKKGKKGGGGEKKQK
jgi:hypothetical protein